MSAGLFKFHYCDTCLETLGGVIGLLTLELAASGICEGISVQFDFD